MPAPAHRPVDSVTDQTFAERALRSEHPVLIQFWTTWCHSCRVDIPIVERLAAEPDVVKIRQDEQPELAARHGVTAAPALAVHAGGRPAGSLVGAAPQHILEQQVASALRKGGDAR
ncbi:thiol reductase thioredoxin [Nonomuraea deserti]|uniref:Thioredoxin n=1 Tax=Nonomuraea deserti TaxID=1848322 RepID=A0A4R4UNA0_9ACTN|nr:thioredoxin domain-containing protein [Nonomuraea deserti]TDC93598.1 thiol reductase thioredoxin [Nonomuraea deserti]